MVTEGVDLNPIAASGTTPQAWFHNGNWFYNYPGALQEAKALGKRLPTIEELRKYINSIP